MHILGAHTEPRRPANKAISVESHRPQWIRRPLEGSIPGPVLHARWNLASVRLSRLAAITTKLSPPTTRATRHVPRCGWYHGYHTPPRPPLPCSWNSSSFVSHTPPPPRPPWSPILAGGTALWSRQALVGTGPAERIRIPPSILYAISHGAVTARGANSSCSHAVPATPRREYPVRGTATAADGSRFTLAPASRPCSPHRSACRLVYKY